MKKIKSKSIVIAGLMIMLSTFLFSFKSGRGGDSFTIHLNNKLLVHQFLHGEKSVKTIMITLQAANSNDELRVSFSHCGLVGKNRTLTIKDGQQKILKQWKFENSNASMVCRVKDILKLEKESAALQLVYSSDEIPGGMALASVVTENSSTVKK